MTDLYTFKPSAKIVRLVRAGFTGYRCKVPKFAALAAFVVLPLQSAADDPWGFFLTWQRDPATTMTVQWLQASDPVPFADGAESGAFSFDVPNVGYVSIDGHIDEWWERGLEVALLGDENNVRPAENELSAEARVGWNEDGLLVALRVRDDTTIEYPQASRLWAGDSVELFVADELGSNNRYQAIVTPGHDPEHPEPRRFFTSAGTALPVAELSVLSGRRVTADGYEIEFLLPWTNLPEFSARPGAEAALQIYVNDRRSSPDEGVHAGRQRILWYPEENSFANPMAMHRIRLAEETTAAARVRLSYDATDKSLQVYASPENAGETIDMFAGERELGGVELVSRDSFAYARFSVPAAPEGRQWGAVSARLNGTLVGLGTLPRQFKPPQAAEISYWPADKGDAEKQTARMEVSQIDGWAAQSVQRIELTDLKPGTDYRFRAGVDGPEFGFRTMPTDLTHPLRIAVGGDTRHTQEWMERTNRVAMRYSPDFIIWGGDFAYADGLAARIYRWEEWFDALDRTLIDEDGRIVPIVGAIGNHEVQRGYYTNHADFEPTDEWRLRVSPYFYQLFAFPGHPGYATLDFGEYMSLIILDTDHTNPVEGEQTEWLEKALGERAHLPHVFPVYHVPGFPSHRDFMGRTSVRIREHWVPLFESHDIAVAFENHDHTYKRTVPIRDGEQHPRGVVYLGDGAWGVGVRSVHDPAETWYLERADSQRHAIIMTLHGTHRHFLVVNEDGEVIDEYPETPVAEPPPSASNPRHERARTP
ncbi:MAG: metallophosphoesterase [Opitutales bacterium]|nr:metallophosphoesterase [Opitutales bacterium]